MLHGLQHLRVTEHQSRAAQSGAHIRLQLFIGNVALPRQDHAAGRLIQHAAGHDGMAEIVLSLLLQRKEVQQHLDTQPIADIREVKALFAGLVVHHPQIQLPVVEPAVHPVHLAGHRQGGAALLHGDGGQIAVPAAKAQFEGHRRKI